MKQEATEVEWAVQYRTYIGGKYERTVPHESKAKAEAQVARFNAGKPKDQHARLAFRYVTKWTPA